MTTYLLFQLPGLISGFVIVDDFRVLSSHGVHLSLHFRLHPGHLFLVSCPHLLHDPARLLRLCLEVRLETVFGIDHLCLLLTGHCNTQTEGSLTAVTQKGRRQLSSYAAEGPVDVLL